MLKNSVLWLFVLYGTTLFAQNEFLWYHQYGSDEGREYARSIIEEDDGSFSVIGKTEVTENGEGDILLMRFDQTGDSLHSIQYDIGANDYPRGSMKIEDDYYIGYGGSQDEERDISYYWLSLINDNLEIEDIFLFEAESWYVSEAIRTSNGDFLMVGDDCILVSDGGEILAQPDVDFGTLRSVIELEEGRFAVLRDDSEYIFELNGNLEIQDTLSCWGESYDLIKGADNSIYRVYWPECLCICRNITKYDLNWEIQWITDSFAGSFSSLFECDDILYVINRADPGMISFNKHNGEELDGFRFPMRRAYLSGYIFREDDIVCVGEIDEDIWIGALDRNPDKITTENDRNVPVHMELSVYPNPFNSTTTINYSLNQQSEIGIQIFNTDGQLVELLLHQERPAGRHRVVWKAGSAPAGLYLVRLETPHEMYMRKTLLIK